MVVATEPRYAWRVHYALTNKRAIGTFIVRAESESDAEDAARLLLAEGERLIRVEFIA